MCLPDQKKKSHEGGDYEYPMSSEPTRVPGIEPQKALLWIFKCEVFQDISIYSFHSVSQVSRYWVFIV